MRPIIRASGVGKQYRIGARAAPYATLRESLMDTLRSPFQRFRSKTESLWALRDVSFDVAPGQAVGIIGRNGAGKSTLLKVLSRITEPSSGRVELYGRVASLLEVGTGFHPELTGRENIYLNGAILGMRKAEIDRKFDEIVAFSEVERFLETPVKHYSSGMYVRLAFGVAAHLEPEILLVDEVLAVGDAAFQKKCLRKMDSVTRGGRTVLFVSHNMGAVRALCQRVIWLEDGRTREDGSPSSVTANYLSSVGDGFAVGRGRSDEEVVLERVMLRGASGETRLDFAPGEDLVVEVHYEAKRRIAEPHFWIGISSQHGPLFGANMLLDGRRPAYVEGRGILSCVFESIPLLPQLYTVHAGVRAADGLTFLTQSKEVAFFNVLGRMADLGYAGERADIVSWDSTPVIVSYRWRLPDGTEAAVGGGLGSTRSH